MSELSLRWVNDKFSLMIKIVSHHIKEQILNTLIAKPPTNKIKKHQVFNLKWLKDYTLLKPNLKQILKKHDKLNYNQFNKMVLN